MPEHRARLTSVEVLESFRAALILYVSKARPTLDEVSADIARTRTWLQVEQRARWEDQLRRRRRRLEEAQAALFSAGMSNLRSVTSAEQMAVRKAKQQVEEAEEKLKKIKYWDREFGNRLEPLERRLGRLQTHLANDLTLGIAWLLEAGNTLDAYTKMAAPPAAGDVATTPSATEPAAAGETAKP